MAPGPAARTKGRHTSDSCRSCTSLSYAPMGAAISLILADSYVAAFNSCVPAVLSESLGGIPAEIRIHSGVRLLQALLDLLEGVDLRLGDNLDVEEQCAEVDRREDAVRDRAAEILDHGREHEGNDGVHDP